MARRRSRGEVAAEQQALSVEKSDRMAAELPEVAARVPLFDHITYHPDRYSSKGARKASGHGAGARRREASSDA